MFDLSLDVSSPEQVPPALEKIADCFRQSADELAASWQDASAGAVWRDIAAILDRAAKSVRTAIKRRG